MSENNTKNYDLRQRSIYIEPEYWNEAKEICESMRPPQKMSRYITEAIIEKNDRIKKEREQQEQ